MGKKKAQTVDLDFLDISELSRSMPEQDPLFMDYCSQVINCATQRANLGRDCETCQGKDKCALYFDTVSGLSARRSLTPDRHQYYLKQFLQLMGREAAL